jgi:pSer/pThr/pTyr-binding forkhead associated (FHA) protein
MNRKHLFPPTATRPGLVLLYGTAGTKDTVHPLDCDATIVGRSRGCDLCLQAPDVSGVHCVITRGAGGYGIRDCASRAGTRVNGEPVEQGALHDGDVVKVGPFTFRVSLPPAQAAPARAGHLDRKRRNLARLALGLRRRLRELQSRLPAAELRAQASALRQRVRDYDQRVLRLDQAQRDLNRDRELLVREQVAFHARVRAAEEELARRRAALQAPAHGPLPRPSGYRLHKAER